MLKMSSEILPYVFDPESEEEEAIEQEPIPDRLLMNEFNTLYLFSVTREWEPIV